MKSDYALLNNFWCHMNLFLMVLIFVLCVPVIFKHLQEQHIENNAPSQKSEMCWANKYFWECEKKYFISLWVTAICVYPFGSERLKDN